MQKLRAIASRIAAGTVITCLVLTLPMCTNLPAVSNTYAADKADVTKSQFSDLSREHWAYESVSKLAEAGIIAGFPDGRFKPQDTVTYGEYIKMAVMADSDQSINFVNTDETDETSSSNGNWAEGYYETALFKKYLTQNRITKKMLNYPISRRDMALISSAVIGKMTIDNYSEIQAGIKDIDPRTPDEYEITKAYASGVLNGYPDGTFKPDRTLTRAEAAISIERLMKVLESTRGIASDNDEIENIISGPTVFPESMRVEGFPLITNNYSVPLPEKDTELKPIDEIIKHYGIVNIMKPIKYFWFNEDIPYSFKTCDNLVGTERLLFSVADICREVVLINNGNIINTFNTRGYMYGVQGLTEGARLPDYEYIGMFSFGSDIMMVIRNPFS